MVIQPLTKCKKDGELYKRVPEVELQLRQVIHLSSDQLVEFARNCDPDDPNFVLEENLVFLIRHYLRMNQKDIVNELSEILIQRSEQNIKSRLASLNGPLFNEAYQEVIETLFTQILDVSSNQADFLQVRYFLALKMLSIDKFKKYTNQDNKCIVQSELDARKNDSFEENLLLSSHDSVTISPEHIYQERELIQQEWELVQQALSNFDEKIRKAFILRKAYEWPIESNDPDKLTISKYMNVTPKTVYNWLKEAEYQLLEWRKEHEQTKYKT